MSSIITPINPDPLSIHIDIESPRFIEPKPINLMLETLSGVEPTLRRHFGIVDWQGGES